VALCAGAKMSGAKDESGACHFSVFVGLDALARRHHSILVHRRQASIAAVQRNCAVWRQRCTGRIAYANGRDADATLYPSPIYSLPRILAVAGAAYPLIHCAVKRRGSRPGRAAPHPSLRSSTEETT
jgi:hypothetical protein